MFFSFFAIKQHNHMVSPAVPVGTTPQHLVPAMRTKDKSQTVEQS